MLKVPVQTRSTVPRTCRSCMSPLQSRIRIVRNFSQYCPSYSWMLVQVREESDFYSHSSPRRPPGYQLLRPSNIHIHYPFPVPVPAPIRSLQRLRRGCGGSAHLPRPREFGTAAWTRNSCGVRGADVLRVYWTNTNSCSRTDTCLCLPGPPGPPVTRPSQSQFRASFK